MPDYTVQATPKNGRTMNGTPQKVMNGEQVVFASPTGRTAWIVNENGEEVPAPAVRQLPKCHSVALGVSMTPNPRQLRNSAPPPHTPANYFPDLDVSPRSGSWNGPYNSNGVTPSQSRYRSDSDPHGHGPNLVRRERVVNGQDVRTTVMLRNVPYGMTSQRLKAIIDATSAGKYDFSYLRIDFSKNRPIGYAFVNFTDPIHILEFYDRYVGGPWDPTLPLAPGYPPKFAQVAYATVQGMDCIVEKFRNSAIMDEFKDFIPMLWWTGDTAPEPSMIGKRKPFPGVNNESKHQRSRDNATQIGLYASRNRRMNNGGHNRRSQYDRGTTAQIHEDALYNQMSPMQNGYGFDDSRYTLAPGPMPIGPPAPFPPMAYGNGHPYFHGAPAMETNGYGYIHFANPFHGSNAAGPSAPTPRMRTITRGGRGGGGQGRDFRVVPGRDLETAIRQNAENAAIQAAYDRAQANAEAPRVIDAEENEEGNVVNYSAYTSNNGQYSNDARAANGYGQVYYQQY